MKLRSGFVSNSSSSSFTTIGVMIPREMVVEFAKSIKKPSKNLREHLVKLDEPDQIRGCSHPEGGKFCDECGKPTWTKNTKKEDAEECILECFDWQDIDGFKFDAEYQEGFIFASLIKRIDNDEGGVIAEDLDLKVLQKRHLEFKEKFGNIGELKLINSLSLE